MTTATRANARFKHAAHVSWRRVDDEAVLLNVDTSEYYSLDSVGADIWERLGRGETLEAAARSVAADYGVAASRVESDARDLVVDLVSEGLLQPAGR